jgi:hypothetical protein
MMSGGNWWRANEISIGHLTREREVGDRWGDKTAYMNEASERVLARTGLYASMLECSAIKD